MIVAAACGVFVAAMVGMSYAAVPLYDWFCRTTGFGGRTQVATAAPHGAGRPHDHGALRCQRRRRPAVAVRAGTELDRGAASARSSPSTTWRPTWRRARRSGRRPTTSRRPRPASTSRRSTASASPSSGSVRARSARCRSCSTSTRRSPRIAELARPQHDHAVLFVLCAARAGPAGRGSWSEGGDELELGRKSRETEKRRWPTRTPSTTTITSWIRARGRSSARSRPSCSRSG